MGVHRLIVLILIACLMLSTLATLCDARTEARYELRSDGVVIGNDLYSSTSRQTLFHQQSLDSSDAENYLASFPGALEFNAKGSPGDGVDIALPSIHEDTAATVAADSVGFFNSNYNYRTETDYGNVPLSMAYPATVMQAISPAAPVITPMYPEQFGTIAIQNKLKKAKAEAAVEPANETAANETKGNESGNLSSIPLNTEATDTANPGFNSSLGGKTSFLLNITGPKNASSKPEIPRIYPSDYDMLGKDGPVFPNPGIGTFSTNGAGSTGASLTGPIEPVELIPAGSLKGNLTDNQTGNQTAIETTVPAQALPVMPSRIDPAEFTYANFNFSATTEQINDMTLVERMWRNAHRGGTMGKAYAGDTAYPLWIDPYERPYDVSMIDEHWYVLQSALNMCVPGTQILPRFWSLMF